MQIKISPRTKLIASLLAFLLPLSVLSAQPASATPSTVATADQAGSSTEAYINGQTLREGATLADGTVVHIGTSALLYPGVGDREIRTSYTDKTIYQAGTAVAPEGWTLYFSTDHGISWQTSEPVPASSVTDIKATGLNVTAGLINGFSQGYSTETTAAIPASVFSANSGGDGWGVTLMDNYVFNVYHHNGYVGLDCHLKYDSSSCYADGVAKQINNGDGIDYLTGARSNPVADALSGKLYIATSPTSGPNQDVAGVLCIDVRDAANPSSCGFTVLSDEYNVASDWSRLSQLLKVGSKYYQVESLNNRLLCFDSAINAACAENMAPVLGNGDWNSRLLAVGNSIYVSNQAGIGCYKVTDLTQCSGENWPVSANVSNEWLLLQHETTAGVVDGICVYGTCLDLNGNILNVVNPMQAVGISGSMWHDGVVVNHRMYLPYYDWIGCFDFSTEAVCDGFSAGGFSTLYQVTADPENAACLWFNSDPGILGNIDGYTGAAGCGANPVITLQPSQFAPRYSCSSSNGISSWNTLRISDLVGGGTAGSISLTVRKASGEAVDGWVNVPVSLNTDLSMLTLDTALTGSRPTFSFAFRNISGTISSATIALDYQGKGPELCSAVALTLGGSAGPVSTSINGSLTDSLAESPSESVRNLSIADQDGTNLFLSAPSAPRNLSGSGLNTSVDLTFEAPSDDGGTEITGYLYSLDAGVSWLTPSEVIDNGDGTLSISLKRLVAGQTYSMRVLAENAIGRGASASLTVIVQLVEPPNILDTAVDQGPIYMATVNSSNLPYTYTVSPSSVCTVTDNVIALVGEGSCSVTIDQAGDATHIATSDTTSFTVLPSEVVKSVPGSVKDLSATASNGKVLLSWNLPDSDGNSAITDYVIQYKVGSSYVPFIDGISVTRSALVTGLTNGTRYLFRVAAKNSIGQGAYATPVEAAPSNVPGEPTSLSFAVSGTEATLAWQAPTSDGGSPITNYLVYFKDRYSGTWIAFDDGDSSTPGAVVTGLDGVSSYDFKVQAVNAMGAGSGVSTVDLNAVAGDGKAELRWLAPLEGTPVNYVVMFRELGTENWTEINTASTGITFLLTGLNNGTEYELVVAALSDETILSFSSLIAITPRPAPTAPTVSLTPGAGQITVSWSGASGNGATITDYIIHYRANGSNVWKTANDGVGVNSSFTQTGLINGTLYQFEVAGVSAIGTGTFSQIVSATPRKAPAVPTGLTVTTTTLTTASLSWTDPTDNGGATISGYVVQFKTLSALVWSTYSGNEFTGRSVIVRNLEPFTSYSFKVAASNEAGAGRYSAAASGKTLGFTVFFTSTGSTGGVAPAQTTAGTKYVLPNQATLTRTGNAFAGWYMNGTTYNVGDTVTLTKNQNFFPRWILCVLNYTAPDKTSGTLPPASTGCGNKVVRANTGAIARLGYFFVGWSVNGQIYKPRDSFNIVGTSTARAVWANYSITYVSVRSTGGLPPAVTRGYGATSLASTQGTLYRNGYTFTGWILGGITYSAGSSFNVRGNVTAFAKWTKGIQ